MYKCAIFILLFVSTQANSQIISEEWEGKWSGLVKTYSYNKLIDSFDMSLEILPRDTVWDFTLFYDRTYQGKADVRAYQLFIQDSTKFQLTIDEKNSIFLDAFVYDNCIYEKFSGMGSDLQVRMCVSGNDMEYEITSYLAEPPRVSGGAVIEGDTMPEIKSYDLNFLMKAKLKK